MKYFIFLFLFFCLACDVQAAIQSLSPDFSLSGEFRVEKNPVSGKYLPGIGPLEIGVAASIDPYSSAFAMIAFEHGISEVEEAYVKLHSLPLGFLSRVGRMRVDFNHLNQLHAHELPFIEYPRYLGDYFGPEGLVKDGMELSYLLPFEFYSEIKAQWFTGETDNSFVKNHELVGLKWKNFFEVFDGSGLEAGISRLQGTSDPITTSVNYQTQITGTNLRYKQLLGGDSLVVFNCEWLWSHRNQGVFVDTQASFYYVGYQPNKSWHLGAGTNRSVLSDTFLVANFNASEFQHYRLKYFWDEQSNTGFLFTLSFVLGPHPVHEF